MRKSKKKSCHIVPANLTHGLDTPRVRWVYSSCHQTLILDLGTGRCRSGSSRSKQQRDEKIPLHSKPLPSREVVVIWLEEHTHSKGMCLPRLAREYNGSADTITPQHLYKNSSVSCRPLWSRPNQGRDRHHGKVVEDTASEHCKYYGCLQDGVYITGICLRKYKCTLQDIIEGKVPVDKQVHMARCKSPSLLLRSALNLGGPLSMPISYFRTQKQD